MQRTTDRRGKPRVRADFDIRLGLPGAVVPARVRDISASGVCCLTDREFPLMARVELVLLVPVPDGAASAMREVVCSGAVVRSGKRPDAPGPRPYETAIFFTESQDADREALDAFVAAARRSPARAG